jgi:hypothetical protein
VISNLMDDVKVSRGKKPSQRRDRSEQRYMGVKSLLGAGARDM